jgi:hypothetical protein
MVDNFTAIPSATYNQEEKFERLQGHPHPAKSVDEGKVVTTITNKPREPAAVAIVSKCLKSKLF